MARIDEHRRRADVYFGRLLGAPLFRDAAPATTIRSEERTVAAEGYGSPWLLLGLRIGPRNWLSVAPSLWSRAEDLAANLQHGTGCFARTPSPIFLPACEPSLPDLPAGAELRPIREPVASWGTAVIPHESLAFGTVFGLYLDGVLAAWAEATPLPEATPRCGVLLVGIETHPDYRRRGFAKAVLARLTQHVEERDLTPLYFCGGHNVASRKTAEACGYRLYGEWWRIREADLTS